MLERLLLLLPCAKSFSDPLGDTDNLYASAFLLPTGLDERDELLQVSGSLSTQPWVLTIMWQNVRALHLL